MFKFLHTADIHLDSPQLNLDQYDGAPTRLRNPTRPAFDNVIDLAIQQQVRFMLIAGDLYDGDSRDFQTPLHFRDKMRQLREFGIRVFIIQGNHDAENHMSKAFALQLPDNVMMFDTRKPETVHLDDLQVAIHGQGFATRDVTDDLSSQYPAPSRGCLNIGMLHSNCGGYDAHRRYAPSTVVGLTNKGYDYWALGHIHKRERLAGPDPWIVYPGNPQGRHIREDGPRGCVVATVEGSRVTKTQWHDVDVVRWQVCQLDASGLDDAESIVSEAGNVVQQLLEAADNRPLALRFEVSGATKAHSEWMRHADHWDRRLRIAMLDRFDDYLWVEKINVRTRADVDVAAWQTDDVLGQLLEGITDAESIAAVMQDVQNDYERLLNYLPTDPRLVEPAIAMDDSRWEKPQQLFSEVKQLLIGRLLQSGDPS